MKPLVRALQESGRSRHAIAKASGLLPERLDELLDDDSQPTYSELRSLAKALHRNVTDLVGARPEGKAAVLFRTAAPGIPEATQVSGRIDQLLEIRPAAREPTWFERLPGEHATREDAETAAAEFRRLFVEDDQMGPLLTLGHVLDELEVLILTNDGERIEGASAIADGVAFVFLSRRFAPRMLFTLGHELGHLIVHRGRDFGTVDEPETVDRAATSGSDEERYCNWFASALLLPPRGVGTALKKFREKHKIPSNSPLGDIEIIFLSHFFGVSFLVAGFRCEQLKLLPAGGAVSLYQQLVKEHENPERRAKEIGFPDRPSIELPRIPKALLRDVIAGIRGGDLSIGRAAGLLNVSIREIMRGKTEASRS